MERASQIIGKISAAPKRGKSASGSDPVIDSEQIACAAWPSAVGKTIARHTRAVKLVRNRMVIEVEDAIWQRNLFTMSGHVLRNLAKALGPGVVTDIEFRVMPPRREPQRANASQPKVLLPDDEADAIADPGMRRLYRSARQKESA